jgi:O-antigen/teichoic acid export membrane protein
MRPRVTPFIPEEGEQMSLKSRAVHGVKWSGMSTTVTTVLNLLQTAVLARLLAPADFGLMAMLMVVIGLAQIFTDMGIRNAIIQRRETTRDELSSLYWLNIFSGVAVFLLLMASSPLIVRLYNEPLLGGLVFWMALTFIISSVSNQYYILLQKDLKFKRLAGFEIVSMAIGATVAICSAFWGQGVFSFIWGHLATASSKTVMALFCWRSWAPRLHFSRRDLDGYISFGMYQMGQRGVDYLSWNLDKLLIGRLLGSEALGYYSVAYQLMVYPMRLINPVVTQVAFPVFSSIQEDDERLRNGYLAMTRVMAFVNIPVYLGLFAVAGPVIGLCLGEGWRPVIDVFRILALLGVSFSLGNSLGSILLAKGRADIGFWSNLLCLPVFAGAIVIGSFWGILGVAWALLLAVGVGLIPVDLWIYWHIVRLRPMEYLGSIAPFFAVGVVMAACVAAAGGLLPVRDDALRLAVLVPVGAAVYLGGVFLVKGPFLSEVRLMVTGKTE